MKHPDNCPCVVCNAPSCTDCGIKSSEGRHFTDGRCKHRRACEARQMLKQGRRDEAIRHAQRLA